MGHGVLTTCPQKKAADLNTLNQKNSNLNQLTQMKQAKKVPAVCQMFLPWSVLAVVIMETLLKQFTLMTVKWFLQEWLTKTETSFMKVLHQKKECQLLVKLLSAVL